MTEQSHYVGRDLEAMSFARNYHLWILQELRPYIGKHLLEVGAGKGDFSKLLTDTEPETFVAIEPSSSLFPALEESLRGKQNVSVYNACFSDARLSLSQSPDTVIYINVLEHIADDETELRYVYESLDYGGHACVFVPALQWLYGSVDRSVGHFRRYHKKPLNHLMQSIGFEVVKCQYFDIVGILPWWLLFCVFKMELKGNQVSIYDKGVVPVMQKVESMIHPPVGKNLLLVGKKCKP